MAEVAQAKLAELTGRLDVLQGILEERRAQDEQWGGPAHDDSHTSAHWHDLLHEHLYRSWSVVGAGSDEYRQELVKIAAIAVAAVESFDRRQGRHG